MHSDGYILPLLDHLVECGVQVLNPLEVKAGMDAVEIRRRYGNRLTLFGNIDALKLGGPQDALEAELRRKVPLARGGGYIMHSDHSCPPEVTFDQYSWMHKTTQRIFEEATWVRFPVFGETTCDCDTNGMSSSGLPSIKVWL